MLLAAGDYLEKVEDTAPDRVGPGGKGRKPVRSRRSSYGKRCAYL